MRNEVDDLFLSLFRQHRSFVRGLVRKMLRSRDPDDVEDILQETFIKCRPAFEPAKAATARYWFASCAQRNAINRIRRMNVAYKHGMNRDGLEAGPREVPQRDLDPESLLLRKERVRIIGEAIDALEHEKSRAIFRLWFMDGLAFKEISEVLGIPKGTIGSTLFRSKTKIEAWISERHPEIIAARTAA